jgi:hypothetical protein
MQRQLAGIVQSASGSRGASADRMRTSLRATAAGQADPTALTVTQ